MFPSNLVTRTAALFERHLDCKTYLIGVNYCRCQGALAWLIIVYGLVIIAITGTCDILLTVDRNQAAVGTA